MNKTDDILEKLKNVQQPEIDLTEEIMSLLPASPMGEEKGFGKSINFLPIVRTVLSLAAMWIVGFFIYLQYEASARAIAESERLGSIATEGKGMEGGAVVASGGASTLREVYKYRLCQECQKTISYTQIRTMLYENK